MRANMQLHIDNAPKYLKALDNWLRSVSTLTLNDLTKHLNHELSPTLTLLLEHVPLTSEDMLDAQLSKRELTVGNHRFEVKALTAIGGPQKKFNEDGFTITIDKNNILAVVVDGGTQVEQIPSLGTISGGKYIASMTVEFSKSLIPSEDIESSLQTLNKMVRKDINEKHQEVSFGEYSRNTPYASIAAVRIDIPNGKVEIGNAGDVFVVAVDSQDKPELLTVDDVYENDQRTFATARKVSKQYGVTIKEAMDGISRDLRFRPILEEMFENMRLGNIGSNPRLTGSEVFRIHKKAVPLNNIRHLFIFSDGAVPISLDIPTREGLHTFIDLLNTSGLEGIYQRINEEAKNDPDFELHPRFRYRDDAVILQISPLSV